MASWKKVIVSGSNANLASLQVDTLTNGQVVLGGGSGSVLTTVAVNGSGNQVATTGASGVVMSGSFSGSFQGSISGTITSASVANQVAQPLNAGTLISSSLPYSGSVAITFNVATASFTPNQIPKLSSVPNQFSGSNITDTGTQIQIGAGATSGLSVAAGGITVTGLGTFNNDVLVSGNLTVNGTTTVINTTNVFVKDKFIMLNSGSNTLSDGGIIVAYATGSNNASGSALYLESINTGTYGRWAVAFDVNEATTAATNSQYIVTAVSASGVPSGNPVWGGSGNGWGNIYVNSATDDIYIWA